MPSQLFTPKPEIVDNGQLFEHNEYGLIDKEQTDKLFEIRQDAPEWKEEPEPVPLKKSHDRAQVLTKNREVFKKFNKTSTVLAPLRNVRQIETQSSFKSKGKKLNQKADGESKEAALIQFETQMGQYLVSSLPQKANRY